MATKWIQTMVLLCAGGSHSLSHSYTASGAMPIPPRFFGFSSYLGPVVNLSYNDPSIMLVTETLRLGTLRYPGGSTANSWNITSGRWVEGTGGEYAARTNMLPKGTYTPKNYMEGIGGTIQAPPIWNLNLVTMPDAPSQLNTLQQMGVPVEFVELGNEKADENQTWYLNAAEPVVTRTRSLFPNASISVIGCFGLNWKTCAPTLKRAYEGTPRLFDAVTIHNYSPDNKTIMNAANTDGGRRQFTLQSIRSTLAQMEWKVSQNISTKVPIWLDEFNWGGDWSGAVTWPEDTHGGLRGILWATFVFTALDITDTAIAAGRSGFASLDYYSLFYQDENGWSQWASCAKVPNQANRPSEVAFDGVAQIVAHVNYIAFGLNHTSLSVLRGYSNHPECVVGVEFSGGLGGSHTVVVNTCNKAIIVEDLTQKTEFLSYSGFDKGDPSGWVQASKIENLMTPPWQNGPLKLSNLATNSLPPISLTIIH